MHSACCCPRSISHLKHHEFGRGPEGREQPYLLAVHSHCHCPLHDLDCLELVCDLPAGVAPGAGERLAAGIGKSKLKRHCRGASLRHDHRRNTLATVWERRGERVADPAAEGLAVVVAVGDSRAGRLEDDTAQFDKTAQMRLVRLVL